MTHLIGKSIDRYHILEQLGEGGMATVYKAFDTRLERDVAIKIIRRNAFPPDQLGRILKRFEREAKSLARLSHPNIIKVIDYGEYNGAPYLVMEYMPGGTLKEKLKGRAMQWREAVRLLIPIAQALEYAHEQKIIHRDIKPSNILLMQKGQPMLTDFGIAKILEVEETATLTGTGVGVGTPEYMAPEQWTGSATAQTDIYSLGVVLYEMVTGRKPYSADTPAAILLKQATEPLPRPGTYVSDLPDSVEKILLKALARKPQDRYQDAGTFVNSMENLLMGASQSVISNPAPRVNKPVAPDLETQDTYLQGETTSTKSQTGTYTEAPRKTRTTQTMNPVVSSQPKKTVWWPWVIGLGGVVCLVLVAVLSIGGSFFARNLSSSNATNLPIVTDSVATTEIPTLKTDGLLDRIISRGYILVATDPNYKPQSFLDTTAKRPLDTKCPSDALTTAEMQGFDVDVAHKIGDAIGVETCFATPAWDTITAGNWANKWDLSVGSMTITVDRQKILNFSVPYYYTPAVVAVGKDSGFQSLDELAGKNLCAGTSTTYESWINNDMAGLGLPETSVYAKSPTGVKTVTRETDQECAQAFALGNADFVGYVTSQVVVDANITAGMPVVQLGSPVYSEDLAVALDRSSSLDSTSLREAIDKIINQMHIDGTLSNLSINWFGLDLTQDPKP